MKDNFKLIEKMLNEMGIDEIPDSFKEVSAPKSILDFNHEAERFINEPVYYILNVHNIDINKHVLEILLSIHSNVERIIVNTTLHDTDTSIIKLKNAIAAYNYMLSGDIDIPRYILYCDINNKEILKIMFYKTTVVDFTNKQIKMDTFDKVQDLPSLLPSNKFIYFVNSDVARQFKNTAEPFDYNKVQNGAIGVEIVPHHDIDTMYLKWVDCSELSVYERYSKVFNTTISDNHNIKFAENYMAKYESGNKHINDINEEKTYIFMVNNGAELLLMIADGDYQPMKIIRLQHKNSPVYLSSFAVKYASYLTGDIVVVSCGGIVEYITDYLIGAILTVTDKNVEKVIYDLDMDLPVGEYLDRLLDYNLEFIYSNPNVVNAISDFLRDGDIIPYINLLLLISRYIKEFTDQPAKVKLVNYDPFSDTLNAVEKATIVEKCKDFRYFLTNILTPIINENKWLGVCIDVENKLFKQLMDKVTVNTTNIRIGVCTPEEKQTITLVLSLWFTLVKNYGFRLIDETDPLVTYFECSIILCRQLIINKMPQYLKDVMGVTEGVVSVSNKPSTKFFNIYGGTMLKYSDYAVNRNQNAVKLMFYSKELNDDRTYDNTITI